MTVMTAVSVPVLNPIAGLQAEVGSRLSNKSSCNLLFFPQYYKTYSAHLNKMPQNVQDKLKLVTPAVVFSETQLH